LMVQAWVAKPEGLRCKNHVNTSCDSANSRELRFNARLTDLERNTAARLAADVRRDA
jgi:hypothetical protein